MSINETALFTFSFKMADKPWELSTLVEIKRKIISARLFISSRQVILPTLIFDYSLILILVSFHHYYSDCHSTIINKSKVKKKMLNVHPLEAACLYGETGKPTTNFDSSLLN